MKPRGLATDKDKKMLVLVSSAITDRKLEHHSAKKRKMLFDAGKLWSTREEQNRAQVDFLFSSTEDATQDVVERVEAAGERVVGDWCQPQDFNKPLLDDCAKEEESLQSTAWGDIKWSLQFVPGSLEKKLAEKVTGKVDRLGTLLFDGRLPRWVRQAQMELACLCAFDWSDVAKLNDLLTNVDEDTKEKYERLAEDHRMNVIKMNKHLSCVALFNFLCERVVKDQWSGSAVVTEFFRLKGLDHEKMKRYCQVMDVEGSTIRRVVSPRGDDQLPRLEYLFADGCSKADVAALDGKEDDSQIGRELSVLFDELRRRRFVCTTEVFEQILAFMHRICTTGRLNGAKMSLVDWKVNKAYFDDE